LLSKMPDFILQQQDGGELEHCVCVCVCVMQHCLVCKEHSKD